MFPEIAREFRHKFERALRQLSAKKEGIRVVMSTLPTSQLEFLDDLLKEEFVTLSDNVVRITDKGIQRLEHWRLDDLRDNPSPGCDDAMGFRQAREEQWKR